MSSVFKFKQFDVDQSGCAMKINTDGVLLAALADSSHPNRILDIGTGTGVLALMLAQRFANAKVEAVEVDEAAAFTAGKNFKASKFAQRLAINHTAIENFQTSEKFDLIISNPPFFVNDLKNAEEKKGIARHTNEQFFTDLIDKVSSMLNANGKFWFILPLKQAEMLIDSAKPYGFSVVRKITLHSDRDKQAFRWIICLSKIDEIETIEPFYIYQSEKVYTEAYKSLLKDFFLGY